MYLRLLHQVGVFIYWCMMHGTMKLKTLYVLCPSCCNSLEIPTDTCRGGTCNIS